MIAARFGSRCGFLLGTLMLLCGVQPALGQVGVVVHGRVEDAFSREPPANAQVTGPASTAPVFTDAGGTFALLSPFGEPLSVRVEQFGYVSQTFELDGDAASHLSVLLLEPAPFEMEEIHVVEESAITELLDDCKARRNRYWGSVSAFDRARLAQFGAASTWDVARAQAPRVFECDNFRSGLCIRDRGAMFRSGFREIPVRVCGDGWESSSAQSELDNLDIRDVALLEVFGAGRGGIHVYTPGYLANSARVGRFVTPLTFGC